MAPHHLWNSLEIAKLVASALTPIVVAVLGLWINHRLKRLEYLQWSNQKLVEKRLEIYSELVPDLNDILCYFTFIGCWKDYSPPEIIKLKRSIDKIVHVNAALFSSDFLTKYYHLMNLCFETYAGWGNDAKLRTLSVRREEAAQSWNKGWASCFASSTECPDPKEIKKAYSNFIACFAREIGVGLAVSEMPSGRIPANIT